MEVALFHREYALQKAYEWHEQVMKECGYKIQYFRHGAPNELRVVDVPRFETIDVVGKYGTAFPLPPRAPHPNEEDEDE